MQSLLNILHEYQHYGLAAFIVTVFLTPVAMRIAHRYGVLDMPDRKLKPHARPIPYLGGAAICAGWVAAIVTAMAGGVLPDLQLVLPILLGGVAMSALGLVDDVRHVRPVLRLGIGTVVIATVVIWSGAGLGLVMALFAGVDDVAAEVGLWAPGTLRTLIEPVAVPLSGIVAVIVVLGACNSSNLIDGLDGLCTGVTAIISLGFFLLASHLAAWEFSAVGDPVRLVLALGMFGAALGFLPWNFNPAKIFMGDAGSVLLGYNCGILILLFAERGNFRWVIGALMIFALPIFDTALAMFRRWRSKRSIFEGDRSHFYDQLVQRGLSVRQTVLISYLLTIVYAGLGLLMAWVTDDGPVIRTRYAVFFYLGVVVITGIIAWRVGLTRPEDLPANGATNGD